MDDLHIELDDDLFDKLTAQAAERGLTAEEYAREILIESVAHLLPNSRAGDPGKLP